MTEFSTPWQFKSNLSVIQAITKHPHSIGWLNGVDWLLSNDVQGDKKIDPSQVGPSWLPSDWNGAARFLGWNRWGQPVVEHPESLQRFVRRGPRQWQTFNAQHPLRADALFFHTEEDWSSSFRGWATLGLFQQPSDSFAWLTAIGVMIPDVFSPSLFQNQKSKPLSGQIPYHSLSERPQTAFIPSGLADETQFALNRWKTTHQENIDDFVSRETKISLDSLSGEQVDVVGLILDSIQKKKDFLLGDQTGMGKGRVLAVIATWAQRHNLIPVFFTERPSLFHDFWRDLEDVTKDSNPFASSFIIHQQARLTWPNGDNWKSPITAKERQENLQAGKLPANVNIILTTYSQFNRKDPKKIEFLKKISSKCLFIFDEAHNATGQSNVREAVRTFIKNSAGCVYASATFGKDADHVSFYTELLGDTPLIHDWGYWLGRTDAEPLRIAVSKRLVKAGRMARREQDLSGLEYQIRTIPAELQEQNEYDSDKFAQFSAGLLALQKALTRFPTAPGQKVDPVRLFGGRLYRLNRLALMILSLDFLIQTSKDLLTANVKPVIVCETTLEQALTEEEEGEVKQSWGSLADVLCFEVGDLISHWTLPSKGPDLDAFLTRKDNFIDWIKKHFAHFSPSPLDALRHALTHEGYRIEEVSGRQQKFNLNGEVWEPNPIDLDRVNAVRQFNSGTIDVLIVTRAGCSGISLHASTRFKDQRPRELVEWQIPRNVAERMQFFGRVYRKDQVVHSSVSTLALNLPSERRGQAHQAKKLQALCHFTMGQGTNEAMTLDCQDYLLHPAASEWALQWLNSYPQWAYALGLSPDSNQRQIAWMDRIFSRLPLLSVKQQQDVISFWDEAAEKLFTEKVSISNPVELVSLPITSSLRARGFLSQPTTRPDDRTIPEEWKIKMNDFSQQITYAKPVLDAVKDIQVGYTLRWKHHPIRKVVSGRILGVWCPPKPFDGFWHAYSIEVWSPLLEHSVFIPIQHLMDDASFQIQARSFTLDASDIAHKEHHSSRWAIEAETERLLLWKAHHRLGEWDETNSELLWLPTSYTPERIRTMTVPLSQPHWVLGFSKIFINEESIFSYDTKGNPIGWSLSERGEYTLTWTFGANLDDGPLVSAVFRQNYGSPRKLSDGRLAMTTDLKTGRSLLFHLFGRGVIFGVPATFTNKVLEFEDRQSP